MTSVYRRLKKRDLKRRREFCQFSGGISKRHKKYVQKNGLLKAIETLGKPKPYRQPRSFRFR